VDSDQYQVDAVLEYRGDPEIRKSLWFLVKFSDGDEQWLPFTKDLSDSLPFENFCNTHPPLMLLLYSGKELRAFIKNINKTPITEVSPGIICYIDIRSWGWDWYSNIGLDITVRERKYVVSSKYIKWENTSHTKIVLCTPLFDQEFSWSHIDVLRYGLSLLLTPEMVLITAEMIKDYPKLLAG
jgi:hypothetical protein